MPDGLTLTALSGWSYSDSTRSEVDFVLVNRIILTEDADLSVAQTLGCPGRPDPGGGIQLRDSRADRSDTEVLNLAGKTVVPGLAENHLHGAGGGDGVDPSRIRSMEKLLAAIAERVRSSGPNELVVTNPDWHEAQLRAQRLPLRWDLDQVAPENPW